MARLDSTLKKVARQRMRQIDGGAEQFEDDLLTMAENLGRRLAASLGVDPDEIVAPDGDDGLFVGRTDFETRIQDLAENPEALRAAILSSSLAEIEDLIEYAGLGDARANIRDRVGKLAGLAERQFVVQGIDAANGALDTTAAAALLGNYVETQIEQGLLGNVGRQTAQRIQAALASQLGFEDVATVARRIADAEDLGIGNAKTEARTRLSMADRFCQEQVRQGVEETGAEFLQVYRGPTSGIVRPFCRELIGKAFTRDEIGELSNGQTAEGPIIAGGGYNCRHYFQAILNDPEVLELLDATRGTQSDITAANAAGRRKKKKRRKR